MYAICIRPFQALSTKNKKTADVARTRAGADPTTRVNRRRTSASAQVNAALKALRDEIMTYYIPPALEIQQNNNMAADIPDNFETEEKRIERVRRANASAISRDRNKFVNAYIHMERIRLEREVNALTKKEKIMIDWLVQRE